MTEFVEYYTLCSKQDANEFIGLYKDREDGNVIATLGRNMISVIKMSNQKQIHSWTVFDKLTSKVLYDHKSGKYVAIFGNKYIKCWDEDVSNLNNVKKLKFNREICELVYGEELLVLYSDGDCASLSLALDSRKIPYVKNTNQCISSKVVDPQMINLNNNEKMLTYFLKTDIGDIDLVTVYLDTDSLRPKRNPNIFKIMRQDKNITLSGYAVVEGKHSPSLLTFWSDKRLFMMSLTADCSPEMIPGSFISIIPIFNVETPISILGISNHCIAIYGANSEQEGASLILYNTQFKVIKTKQFFKIYFNFSKLWLFDTNVIIAMGQNLSVVSFRMSKELLSDLIGSQISNEFATYLNIDGINEDEELESSLSYKKIESNGCHENITNSITKETDDYEIDTNDEKNCNLSMYLDLTEVETADDNVSINLMSNFMDNGFATDEVNTIVKELENCGASENEITEKLLTVLLKGDLYTDIAVCLRRYSNISEKMLIKTLKYALQDVVSQNNEHKDLKNINEPMVIDENKVPNEIPYLKDLLLTKPEKMLKNMKRTDLINLVLSCSFDTDSISMHIRKEINFSEVVILLEHLYNIIMSSDTYLEKRPESACNFDDDYKTFCWFGMLLSTHLQKFALSKDPCTKSILIKWRETLKLYRKDNLELAQLKLKLDNFINKKKLSKMDNISKWYSIEQVTLY